MLSLPDSLMRRVVLYVDSLKIGGAERVTLTFARWLRQNGWDPIVLTRQSVELDFYPIPAGVERAVEPRDPRWLRLLGRWGFPWRVLRLRRWLREQRVSLAIGMTTKPSVKLLLAARPLGLPCVDNNSSSYESSILENSCCNYVRNDIYVWNPKYSGF